MKRIAEERKNKDLSQAQLAEMLGVSQQTISKYENGSREPDNATLLKLSKMFDVSTDYLLENPRKCEEINKNDPHNNPNENVTTRNDLEKIIQDYVVNKELFHPDSDSYEDLKKIMAEIISNNENIILEILNNRRNLNERK